MHRISAFDSELDAWTDQFQNKYRIQTARAPWWDYGSQGAYFVTICTSNNTHYFGEISEDRMHLSEIGVIVRREWLKTAEIRPDMNLELGEFVVMPNHFHGIITIGENRYNTSRDAMHGVSTEESPQKSGPQSKNLSSIIRGFKSAVTAKARPCRPDFAWQSRFHDHIIRDEKSFQTISEYIRYNPLKWSEDKYYTEETL